MSRVREGKARLLWKCHVVYALWIETEGRIFFNLIDFLVKQERFLKRRFLYFPIIFFKIFYLCHVHFV